LLAVLLGYWVWPRTAEPAPWAQGSTATLNRLEPSSDKAARLFAQSEGEITVAVTVTCGAAVDGSRVLDVRLHTSRDGADAEMHTRVIAMPHGHKQRAEIRRFAAAEISTDGGPAEAVALPLDGTGSRAALALVREADGFRIGYLDQASGAMDYLVRQGLRLHARQRFAVRLPVGEAAAVARLSNDALVGFHTACGQ
jgi:hypothetical protein